MIKVNLLEQKSAVQIPIILGMDFSKVPVRKVVVALVIYYLPVFFAGTLNEEGLAGLRSQISQLENELKEKQTKLKGQDELKKELDEYDRQEKLLLARSKQVDDILKYRTNPKDLLERLARNIPEDLWLDQISVGEDKKIGILGGASNYQSIGKFIVLANESTFFGKSLALKSSDTVEKKEGSSSMRYESFEIEGAVVTFDPWAE